MDRRSATHDQRGKKGDSGFLQISRMEKTPEPAKPGGELTFEIELLDFHQ
jgi:hypothetical protein